MDKAASSIAIVSLALASGRRPAIAETESTTEAPWELEVDFGKELAPHLLEAVAYAGDGREIGRASQWVNLTPKESGMTIALDRDRSTRRALR